MNNTFPLEKISKTGNLDSNLILRHYELKLMARFIESKPFNQLLGQNQKAKELGSSSSTLQRHRQDVNRLSPYRIPSNSYRRRQKTSNEDLIKPERTSNDPK